MPMTITSNDSGTRRPCGAHGCFPERVPVVAVRHTRGPYAGTMGYHRMSDDQVRQFLIADPARPAILGTTRADGRPHVAPVWYVLAPDGTIIFTTGEDTVKGRNLRRSGWASLCVDDDVPPFSFVVLEGP